MEDYRPRSGDPYSRADAYATGIRFSVDPKSNPFFRKNTQKHTPRARTPTANAVPAVEAEFFKTVLDKILLRTDQNLITNPCT
jgi:hypothetical protein